MQDTLTPLVPLGHMPVHTKTLWERWQPRFKETFIVLALAQLDLPSVSRHGWRDVPIDPTLCGS